MSFYLDPKDVLNHLNQLGYRNITKDQLREFIQDLKKLIKYDMKHGCREPLDMGAYVGMTLNEITHESNSTVDTTSTTATKNSNSALEDSRTSTENSDLLSSMSYSTSCMTADSVDCCKMPKTQKVVISSKPAGWKPACTQPVTKPKSSFIRPWHLAGPTVRHADPVSLFHRYQAAWKLQKLPGEDRHDDLRWLIRERMMGREVNPRPTSRPTTSASYKK